MIFTFCGHSDYIGTEHDKASMLSLPEEHIKGEQVDFLLGEYGGFDRFSYACCQAYKTFHPNAKLIFITPYITESYKQNRLRLAKDRYDEIIYPPLEHVPLRFAISARNKWMVEQAEFVVAYVTRSYGGAYETLKHAQRKRKIILSFQRSVISL